MSLLLPGVKPNTRTALLLPEQPKTQTREAEGVDSQTKQNKHESKPLTEKHHPTEILTGHAERFRMRLIRDFRLLENLNEMEQGLEAPKYHPDDIENKRKRKKILSENPYALVKFSAIPKLTSTVTKQERRWKRIKCRETTYPPLDMWANWVVDSNWFQNFMLILILVNAVLLVVDAEIGETTESTYMEVVRVIRTCDYCCLWIFIVEILLKWVDDFKTFWKNGWNELDFYITVVSILPELIRWFNNDVSNSGLSSLSFLRVLRITRLLKMVSRFEQARIILMSVSKAFSAMSFILLLLALFMWMFALMGEVIFDRYTRFDGKAEGVQLLYQKAFSDILWSFATLFQLMTLDHWLETLQDLLKVMTTAYDSTVTVVYIMAWIWVGSFVFKNIFAGIMVNNFQTIRNDLHWEKTEKEAKNEVDKFQKEFVDDLKTGLRKSENELEINIQDEIAPDHEFLCQSNEHAEVVCDRSDNILQPSVIKNQSVLSVLTHRSVYSQTFTENQGLGEFLPHSDKCVLQAQWENIVQRHLDSVKRQFVETVWSRDCLFKFYQTMENMQENVRERNDVLCLLNLALLQIHDR